MSLCGTHPPVAATRGPTMQPKGLTNLDYSIEYYEEHKAAGLDYLGHGYWQQSYGKMVTEATLQDTFENPVFLDAGCACGSILQGFKSTGVFSRVYGQDLSQAMVDLGRNHFHFDRDEIRQGSIASVDLPSETVTLLHSAQVLEHIPDTYTDDILDEFARLLRTGGRAFLCLDAIKNGETKEMYMGDPTHYNIQPVRYWTEKLQKRGLLFDIEAYDRFVRHPNGPTEGEQGNFYQRYPAWSTWTLIKA
jgi:SAM-dependent methyltransferase